MNPEELARAAERLAEILVALADQDSRWSAAQSISGVQLTRGWDDGTVDVIFIASGGIAAYGKREDPTGREVWGIEGNVDQVIAALDEQPEPGAPHAPDGTDHTPKPDGMWEA